MSHISSLKFLSVLPAKINHSSSHWNARTIPSCLCISEGSNYPFTYRALPRRHSWGYFWSFIVDVGRGTIRPAGPRRRPHYFHPHADRCRWIVKLNERERKRESEREKKKKWNNPMARADGKGTRRRAGNRARVEFALTRPVAASGVVARLVAGPCKLESSKPTTCIAIRARKQKALLLLLRVLGIVCPSRARSHQVPRDERKCTREEMTISRTQI